MDLEQWFTKYVFSISYCTFQKMLKQILKFHNVSYRCKTSAGTYWQMMIVIRVGDHFHM